jgi:hypothetical protein
MVGSYASDREDVWEENIRIYQKESIELAHARAKGDAFADQTAYETADGHRLSWRVHSVPLVKELASQGLDGEEIFSRSLTNGEARSLLKAVD